MTRIVVSLTRRLTRFSVLFTGAGLLVCLEGIASAQTFRGRVADAVSERPVVLEQANTNDVPADTFYTAGRVEDAETGQALGEAIVEVPGLAIRSVSGDSGRVELGRLPAGEHRVRAERSGYEILEGEIEVPGGAGFLMLLNRTLVEDTLAPGEIVGRVTEEGTGRGLPDVEITVPGPSRTREVVSNQEGRFTLTDVPPGLAEIRLNHLGFAARAETLVVHPGRTVEITATMSAEPIELEPIEVTVRSRHLERNGFYRRAARSRGARFTREEIATFAPRSISDLLPRVSGVRVRYGLASTYAESRRTGTGCVLPVYLDGVRQPDPDLDQFPPDWLEAAEFYTGLATPVRYRGIGTSTRGGGIFGTSRAASSNGCGVVLLWTRR